MSNGLSSKSPEISLSSRTSVNSTSSSTSKCKRVLETCAAVSAATEGGPPSRRRRSERTSSQVDVTREGTSLLFKVERESSQSPLRFLIKKEEEDEEEIQDKFQEEKDIDQVEDSDFENDRSRKRLLIGDEFYSETASSLLLSASALLHSSNLISSCKNTVHLEERHHSDNRLTESPSSSPKRLDNDDILIRKDGDDLLNDTGGGAGIILYDYRYCSSTNSPLNITLYGSGDGNGGGVVAGIRGSSSTSSSSSSTSSTSSEYVRNSRGRRSNVLGNDDMSSLLGQAVKNEPEDLTGVRRDSNSHEDHHVVLSGSDLGGFSSHGGPSPSNPSYGANEFFDPSPRGLYSSSDSYRNDNGSDLYTSASTSDFGHRSDVQYVQYSHYKGGGGGPLVSAPPTIPSPDSGIGDNMTTLNQNNESFEYPHTDILNDINSRKPWHDYGRQNEEKINIPKIFSPYGFKCILEATSSSSVRREDDKITYVNKGQFYGITLEYTPDPDNLPLKSSTVKSVIMLVFREGKTPEEELKAWQFWHARQHSAKQRILDADTKNSVGLVGCIDEISHNALSVYWNPLESPAKVNIAVQCLSTDFSTQKGVKGLPLHIQIDTYEDPRDSNGGPVYHRSYCQIKVFCDKGAERKARDEERRASKRRMTTTGKRRMDEMYHTPSERSEFYSMADLSKPVVLFSPTDDPDKSSIEFGTNPDIPSFYTSRPSPPTPHAHLLNHKNPSEDLDGSGGNLESVVLGELSHHSHHTHHHHSIHHPLSLLPPEKRPKLIPPQTDRIMIYVRQETEDAFTPLHLIPPTVPGLIRSVESKYKINANNIRFLYRKTKQGILAKIDDDMLQYYCNEDVFLMQVMVTEGTGGDDNMVYDITLTEC